MHFYLSQCKIAFALLLFPASPWCAYCSFSWSKRSNEDHKRRYISSSEKHLPSATSVCKSEATFSLLKITTYGYSFNNFLHSSNPSIKKMHTYHTTAKFFFFYFFFLLSWNQNIFWVIFKANSFNSEIKYWTQMGNSKVSGQSLLLHLFSPHHHAKTFKKNLTVSHL